MQNNKLNITNLFRKRFICEIILEDREIMSKRGDTINKTFFNAAFRISYLFIAHLAHNI